MLWGKYGEQLVPICPEPSQLNTESLSWKTFSPEQIGISLPETV